MVILDGKKLAEKITAELKKEIKKLKKKPSLAVVLIGQDPASLVYIQQKEKKAKELGINFILKKFKESISFAKLREEINKIISENPTGIIIQLPLPLHLKKYQQKILDLIPLNKDVDVLSKKARLKIGEKDALLPPTIAGILEILKEYKIGLKNKKIAVIGKGLLVGEPLIQYLNKKGFKVKTADEFTENLKSVTKKADIIITGVGKPNLIKGNMVKKGVVVVDAGISKIGGKLNGDVDFESVFQKASFITPVPGGVGPMTVIMIFKNLVKLAE